MSTGNAFNRINGALNVGAVDPACCGGKVVVLSDSDGKSARADDLQGTERGGAKDSWGVGISLGFIDRSAFVVTRPVLRPRYDREHRRQQPYRNENEPPGAPQPSHPRLSGASTRRRTGLRRGTAGRAAKHRQASGRWRSRPRSVDALRTEPRPEKFREPALGYA